MSYCRFAWGGSDVYVFEAADGLTCCGCRLNDGGFVCDEPEAMIVHLAQHRRAGSFVPDHAIDGLWSDIPGAQRPTRKEPRPLTFSSLLMDLACIEHELLRQYERLSAEERASHALPKGMKARLREHRATLARFEADRKKRTKRPRTAAAVARTAPTGHEPPPRA